MLHRANPVGRILPPRLFSAAVGTAVENAKAALARADAVCFDVDSTVITEEGIDVLAAHCGAGEAVAALTASAMGGTMLFQDALKARLDLIRPSAADVAQCLAAHPPSLSPGVANLVDALHAKGAHVYLVSGGFRLMIEPVAARLGVPKDRVIANTLNFVSGEYSGFDPTEFTSADQGKTKALTHLKATHGYETVVMVGDGATDMQAKAPGAADAFIGFGGVAVRPAVQEKADWFVTDFEEMISIVKEAGGGTMEAAATAAAEPEEEAKTAVAGGAMPTKIFCANLNYDSTASQISARFAEYGEVLSANVVTDSYTGKSKGFGFVEMASEDQCRAAIEALNGKEFDGRLMAAELAGAPSKNRLPRKERVLDPSLVGRKLYIGNLSWQTKGERLLEVFNSYGTVVDCHHVTERGDPERMRGFGFVTFKEVEDADRAIAGLNDTEVDGRFIQVRAASA